jgi:YD repeat-containing protein
MSGNPLQIATYDESGWIITTLDLLGRTTSYTDVYGNWTGYEYNALGQLTRKFGDMGEEIFYYDSYRRLSNHIFDGVTYATIYYDTYGRTDYIDYNNAGSMRMTLSRDALGRITSKTYRMGDGTTQIADTITQTQSGRTVGASVTSAAATRNSTFAYDTVGRLTGATIGTSTFCYDYADRLTSSSGPLYSSPTYDSHGNMTQIGTGTTPLYMYYDSSDRNSGFEQFNSSGTGTGMYYERDAQSRITARHKNTITNWSWAGAGSWYYNFTGAGSAPDFVRDGNWDIVVQVGDTVGIAASTMASGQADVIFPDYQPS